MLPIKDALEIMGAAEGSWYFNTYSKKWVDLRYTPVFAGPGSGLSFGVYQHDAYANLNARDILSVILSYALAAGLIQKNQKDSFLKKASSPGAGSYFSVTDKQLLRKALTLNFCRSQVNALDQKRAMDFQKNKMDPIVLSALKHWQAIQIKNPEKNLDLSIFTESKKEYKRFYAYLMASLNKREKNDQLYRKWLCGQPIPLRSGEIRVLDDVPTLDDAHAFFSSLQIWQGVNGNYNELRKRLDPVLDEFGY